MDAPRKLETLQAIMKLPRKDNLRYYVFAQVNNKDVIDKDGKIDDFRGIHFSLGGFQTKKEADQEIKNLMIKTGHPDFYLSEYATPTPITVVGGNSDNITKIYVDTNNKIKELETAMYQESKELYEKNVKIKNDITKEGKDECDPDNIEYFKHQCYLAIKCKQKYEQKKKELELIENSYNEKLKLIQEHYQKYPEHEEQWLPLFKEKLTERGELKFYDSIEQGYKLYRDEILGITNNEVNLTNNKEIINIEI